ncbi:MAG TPA: biotin transporter BioY [Candidatus Avidehalobacter gallistercoris]|uniref:Biotin transporter n=1 Tax=Candidatus Avidehalobacter gallistercoris TaxID=2840694 RepID=A0A9D1KYY2_9FIRM|nr:biotin transporter BioY [Candidatus Avidehalobacter gallistercoris]
MQNSNIRKMSVMAMLVALLVVCSQISVPVGSVPVTAQPLAIMLIGLLLSPKYAVATVLVWVLAGGVGLPFFANFKSGFGVLLGPTGGYIYGYIIGVFIMSLIAGAGKNFSWARSILACVAGMVFVYLLGAVQLKILMDLDSFAAAFVVGGVPYIFFEPLKVALAVIVAKVADSRGLQRF